MRHLDQHSPKLLAALTVTVSAMIMLSTPAMANQSHERTILTASSGFQSVDKPDNQDVLAPPDTSPATETFQALDAALSSQDSTTYGGMNLNAAGDQVIHVVGGAQSQIQSTVNAALAALPQAEAMPTSSISYVPATVSLATMVAGQQLLTSNVALLKQEGVQLVSYGPDVISNELSVLVLNLTPSGVSAIQKLVGTEGVDIESTTMPVRGLSRETDSSPWWGGDLLDPTPSGEECTSGFPIDVGGVTYNTTAGHCGSGTIKQNGQSYGVTVKTYNCNNCNGDAQTVSTYPGSADGVLYTGAPTAETSETVGTVGLSQESGEKVCFDGYFWTAYSGGKVACTTIAAVNVCDINSVTGYNICGQNESQFVGSGIAAPGDSGGPAYNYNVSSLNALGMIDSAQCNIDPPPDICYRVWYMPQGYVQYAFGGSTLEG